MSSPEPPKVRKSKSAKGEKRKRSSKDEPKSSESRRQREADAESEAEDGHDSNDNNDEGLLEVDLSLPAPLSKKQKRLQKKGKPVEGETEETPKAKQEEDEKVRSEHGIWIGNLPWSATKLTLRQFFLRHMGIQESAEDETNSIITRIHMPAPRKTEAAQIPGRFKPTNKGFAYVDFATAKAMSDALVLTETEFNNRRVLIKPASSFDGRPDRPAQADTSAGPDGDATRNAGSNAFTGALAKQPPGGRKPPNKRVFIGNLGFETTSDDLKTLYGACGDIAMTHVATFEDSGKCKGYAWITFEDIPSAEKAVRGWIEKDENEDEDELDRIQDEADAGAGADTADSAKGQKQPKKRKMRKWWVNRLNGRQLRCEFAEDADTRYAKRFGKDAKQAASRSKRDVTDVPGLPSNITGAIVAATGKRIKFSD